MDIQVSVRLRHKIIMAIPHYEEYSGYRPPHPIDRNNNNFHQRVNLTSTFQSSGENLPRAGGEVETSQVGVRRTEEVSFIQQLLTELYAVYCLFGNRNRNVPLQQDNQEDMRNNQPTVSARLLPLPDLIQCSLDLSFESTSHRAVTVGTGDSGRPLERTQENYDEENNDWNFELKLSVSSPYRAAGRELRRIADQFSFDFENSTRPPPRRRSIELRLALQMAVAPAILLAGLGIALFRR